MRGLSSATLRNPKSTRIQHIKPTPQDANGRPQASQQPQQLLLLTKGAPEAVEPLLEHVPANYAATYLHHMGRGRRVLALACRCDDVYVVMEDGGALTWAASLTTFV